MVSMKTINVYQDDHVMKCSKCGTDITTDNHSSNVKYDPNGPLYIYTCWFCGTLEPFTPDEFDLGF